MKRILNFRVVEGDPNEVDKNEILLVKDNSTDKVKSIKKRGNDGSLQELIPASKDSASDDYIYCRINSWDTIINGDSLTIKECLYYTFSIIASTSFCNYSSYKGIYVPLDFLYSRHATSLKAIKAIRIKKNILYYNNGEEGLINRKIESLEDLHAIVALFSNNTVNINLALEEITKDEFDNMEIVDLSEY